MSDDKRDIESLKRRLGLSKDSKTTTVDDPFELMNEIVRGVQEGETTPELVIELDMPGSEEDLDAIAAQYNNPHTETFNALRKNFSDTIERLYKKTMDRVGDQLQYAGPGHLMLGIVGTMMDVGSTALPIMLGVAESEVGKQLIEQVYGEKLSFAQVLAQANEKTPGSINLENLIGKLPFDESDYETALHSGKGTLTQITKYAQDNDMTPYEVLNDPEAMANVLVASHGSLEAYEESLQNIGNAIGNVYILAKLTSEAGNMGITDLIATQVPEQVQMIGATMGVTPELLGNIAEGYVRDVATFTATFLDELAHDLNDNLELYKLALE